MVRYLQQFSFFDEEKLASGAIVYDSVARELEKDGILALVPKTQGDDPDAVTEDHRHRLVQGGP